MKLLFTLLLSLMTSCAGACAAPSPVVPPEYSSPTIERQYGATVRLAVVCGENMALGTGVAISPTDIITARHVVDACDFSKIQATALSGHYDAQVITVSLTADVVRLRLISGRLPFYSSFLAHNVPVGATVCSVGGDAHVMLMRKCGEVFSMTPGYVLTSIPAVPGNSGGPVFYGDRLAGIVSMGSWRPETEKVQLFVPVDAFLDLLGGV